MRIKGLSQRALSNGDTPAMDAAESMNVRPVEPDDRSEWLRMRDRLWPGSFEDHVHDIDVYFSKPPRGVTLVIERPSGGLCGLIEISLRSFADGCRSSPVPYIEGWYVDEEMRRRKLGSRLVHAAEAWARSSDYNEIASDADLNNSVSVDAHVALGYDEVARCVCFRKAL